MKLEGMSRLDPKTFNHAVHAFIRALLKCFPPISISGYVIWRDMISKKSCLLFLLLPSTRPHGTIEKLTIVSDDKLIEP